MLQLTSRTAGLNISRNEAQSRPVLLRFFCFEPRCLPAAILEAVNELSLLTTLLNFSENCPSNYFRQQNFCCRFCNKKAFVAAFLTMKKVKEHRGG